MSMPFDEAIEHELFHFDGHHVHIWSELDYTGDVVWGAIEQFGPAYGLEADYDWLTLGVPTKAEAMAYARIPAEGYRVEVMA